MQSPGFQSNVKNIGSPLMQQNQYGIQSSQMGGQFGGYIQQLQKQIGGLQSQIQAMSQRQPQQAAMATTQQAAGTPSKEITPRTSTPFTQEHFDEMIASNSKLSQSDAPQYKSYEAYIDHMTKPRMTREEFDEMISRKPMLSSMAPQYKSYEAFLEHTKNRGPGRSRRYTYGPVAG